MLLTTLAITAGWALPLRGAVGEVRDVTRVVNPDPRNPASFGRSMAPMGDLDGDGVVDLVVGAESHPAGGIGRGAVFIMFLNRAGRVVRHQQISAGSGGFDGEVDNSDSFGSSVACLGDLDADGVLDLAVGATGDDDGVSAGAVWILFLRRDGTVKQHQKISAVEGGFGGGIGNGDRFGRSLAALGDLDDDGVVDLAVGAQFDDDGGVNRGAVWVLFLNRDGTVKSHQKISDTEGGFDGILEGSWFGIGVGGLGDHDGDGVEDLAVSAQIEEIGSSHDAAVWILFLNPDGTVRAHQEISADTGGFGGDVGADFFGMPPMSIGDLDGDGIGDLAVGASQDDDGGENRGAVWILFLRRDGTVHSQRKISDTEGGYEPRLVDYDNFGLSLAFLGDVDGDGVGDLAAGELGDEAGVVRLLLLDGCGNGHLDKGELCDDGNNTNGDGCPDDCSLPPAR